MIRVICLSLVSHSIQLVYQHQAIRVLYIEPDSRIPWLKVYKFCLVRRFFKDQFMLAIHPWPVSVSVLEYKVQLRSSALLAWSQRWFKRPFSFLARAIKPEPEPYFPPIYLSRRFNGPKEIKMLGHRPSRKKPQARGIKATTANCAQCLM